MNQAEPKTRRVYGEAKRRILAYVEEMPAGKEFWYGDIADELDLPLGLVGTNLRKIISDDNPPIATGRLQGRYLRVEQREDVPPRGPQRGDLLEAVGTFKDGSLMLSFEDGSLWKAVQQ